jgi:hypothetical protein
MSEASVEIYEKVVKYVVVKPSADSEELAIKVKETSGEKAIVSGSISSPEVIGHLIAHGLHPNDLNLFNTLTTKDVSILSIIAQPRGATNVSKKILVSTLQGVAADIGKCLIGESVTPEVSVKTESFKSWLAGRANEA